MAAPVLTTTSATFTRVAHIYENTNTGSMPFSLFNYAFDTALGEYAPGASDDVTTTDLIGIAITGVSGITGGIVEFSIDGGAHWAVAANAPLGSAIVFKGDTLLRYTPPADANGTRTITFNAWDGTGGFNSGDIVDLAVTGTGGNTPFSSISTTSDLIIDANDGKVITNMGGNDFAIGMSEVSIGVDKKVLAIGESIDADGATHIAIARYNSDGSLDTSFSTDGKLILDIADTDFKLDSVHSLEVDSSGNYLISGLALNVSTGVSAALLARVDVNGEFDLTFGGGDGYVITTIGTATNGLGDPTEYLTDVAYSAVILQPSESILTAGTFLNASGDTEFALIRHTAAGVLDTTFNTTGSVITGFGMGISGVVSGVLVDANGKVLVTGTTLDTGTTDTSETNVVVRYSSAGVLDASFSGDGIASFDIGLGNGKFNGFAALQSDGKILVTGSTAVYDYNNPEPLLITPGNFVIARLTTTGALDTTSGFGTGGILTTDLGGNDESYDVQVVQVLGVDKILVAGSSYGPDGAGQFVLNRYNLDGTLDNTFSTDGKFEARFPDSAEAYNFAVQADGKILVSGVSIVNGGSDFALLRLNADGTLDNNFTGQNNAPLLDADTVPLTRVAAMFEGDVGSDVLVSYFNQGFDNLGNFVNGASDPDGRDPSQLGIAISGVSGTSDTGDVTLGEVQFSTDNGQTWQTAATAFPGEAIVFAGTTLLRYTPPADASGIRTITFHTWDGTGGYASGAKLILTQ